MTVTRSAQKDNAKAERTVPRITGIDTMRVVANFSVIISHWLNWYGPNGTPLYILFYYFLGNFVHFAVPFFFILSGYFIRHSLGGGKRGLDVVRRYSTRIVPVYIFWMLVYALVPGLGLRTLWAGGLGPLTEHLQKLVLEFKEKPLHFLMTGNTDHLWFLPSLIIGCYWLVIWKRLKKESWIMPLGAVAYGVFLLTGPYAAAFGIERWSNQISRGFLTPIGCMSLGYFIRMKKMQLSIKSALVLVLAGYVLKISERLALLQLVGDPVRQTFMLGTPVMSLGVFFLALASPRFLGLSALSRLGPLTLGVYADHIIIDKKVHQFDFFPHNTWLEFFGPLVIYAGSFAMVYLLARVPFLKRFVSNE